MNENPIELRLTPEQAHYPALTKAALAATLSTNVENIQEVKILKRSIDARGQQVWVRLMVVPIFKGKKADEINSRNIQYREAGTETVHIIGCGPAGMFAALRLLEAGIKPVIIERGKSVKERRRDLAAIMKNRTVNPDSNYCFGEGGAGTYSDGKLYTRSGKRGSIDKILNVFVQHGADADILVDAHPHIGTNKLPGVVEAMRKTILQQGGEIFFDERVEGFEIESNQIVAITTNKRRIDAKQVILATGHSARDIFTILHAAGLQLEAKPFALGVRVEHPQALIDSMQYHCENRGEYLPPASYSVVTQASGRGVFSFCMCPGGIIAPAATAPGEVVVNGWSPSKRNNPFANSGMVVEVKQEDFAAYAHFGPLAGMHFQAEWEQKAWELGGQNLSAPGQRLSDFVAKRSSAIIPPNSYFPGVKSTMMDESLPPQIAMRLREGLQDIGKKMKGYLSEEAIMVGVESRTSSPVRIPRDRDNLQHPQLSGLYPCGEGAGYAGGIVSAAMDGERVADKIIAVLKERDRTIASDYSFGL